jgi:hypothetical protein
MQPEENLNPLNPNDETNLTDETANQAEVTDSASAENRAKRKRIPRGAAPPALDLNEAADVITRFYEDTGGEASYDSLSSITNNSSGSSVFAKKIAALRNYALIFDENRFVTLTELGLRIAAPHDPADRIQALNVAFQNNEIFAKAYERYKGRILPQDEFLINAFTTWVPRELSEEWMQKFKSSMDAAGLLDVRPDGRFQVRESVRRPEPEKEVTPPPPPEETPLPPPINNARQFVEPPPPIRSETPYDVLIRILSPDMEDEEQQAVWTLIRYLKKQEAK